jgi:hypothetical protein
MCREADMNNNVGDLDNNEADMLWSKIGRIISLGDDMARDGNARGHEIYVLARDCRDLLTFDQASREVMRRLVSDDPRNMALGIPISSQVQTFLRDNQKIYGIKQLRTETGIGLREAKDACEAWMANNQMPTW